MRSLKLKVVCALLISLSVVSATAGIKPSVTRFEEGESFDVALSKFNYNRVFVVGESISRVRIPEGTFIIDKSEGEEGASAHTGSVYLKPLFDTEVTAYFTTSLGHHFSLRVSPDESAGKTLEMVSIKPQRIKRQLRPKKVSRHDVRLKALMRAMMGQGRIKGFVRKTHLHEKPFAFKKGLELMLRERYQGQDLTGYIYRIHNTSKEAISLSNKVFANPQALSLALSTQVIKPGEYSWLYSIGGRTDVG